MTRKRSLHEIDHAVTSAGPSSPKRARYSASEVERNPSCQKAVQPSTIAAGSNHCSASEQSHTARHHIRKRRAGSSECEEAARNKRVKRHISELPPASLCEWVSDLPDSPQDFEIMPQPQTVKRTRSASDASDLSLPSDTETGSTVSRETKYSIYKNSRYPTVMESKGSHMRDSSDGPMQEDVDFYHGLLAEIAPLPDDPLWEPHHVLQLRSLLQERSELRVCIDLHPRLVPSSEILALQRPNQFDDLVEGHNDRWVDAIVFYKKLPQPDRTKAYRPSAFTDVERRKLGIVPGCASWFTTREGMLFPYFTCEVKCGKEALTIADRANLNSMTIALRIVVELHRRAGNLMAIHRKILGFSMSHDDGIVRIYAHYPHVDGDSTTYWRRTIREFSYADKDAQERATAYTFVWNVDTKFAPTHLERLKQAISHLPDPVSQPFEIETSSSVLPGSEHRTTPLTPATSTSDAAFVKPGPPKRLTNANLAQQLEEQRKDFMAQSAEQQKQSKEQMAEQQRQSKEQMAEQQRQSKEQMALLERQIARQEEQYKEQIKLLKQLLDQR